MLPAGVTRLVPASDPDPDFAPLTISTDVQHARGGTVLWRVARQIRRVLPRRECVRYRGHHLPPAAMRRQMCGLEFASNDFFLSSGRAEAQRLIARLGFSPASKVVEIGSGLGRLAIGLLQEADQVEYWGVDANAL